MGCFCVIQSRIRIGPGETCSVNLLRWFSFTVIDWSLSTPIAPSFRFQGYVLTAMAKILAFERSSGRRTTLSSDVSEHTRLKCAAFVS